jgi:hypothetical protein
MNKEYSEEFENLNDKLETIIFLLTELNKNLRRK